MPAKKSKPEESTLLRAVRFVSLVQSKTGELEKTHARVFAHWIAASDSIVSAGHRLPDDFQAAPHTYGLLEALARFPQAVSLLQVEEASLKIVAAEEEVSVPCIPLAALPAIFPDPMTSQCGNDLREALGAVSGLMLPTGQIVPKAFVTALKRAKHDIVGYGHSSASFTVWFGEDAWLKTQVYPPGTAVFNLESIRSFPLTLVVKEKYPLDEFSFSYTNREYTKLDTTFTGQVCTFDIESYSNYFLVAFAKYGTSEVLYLELYRDNASFDAQARTKLLHTLENNCIIGFNSRNYDVPMLLQALQGRTCRELKTHSNKIIESDFLPYEVPTWNHIDLLEVAPLKGSLKAYAGRLHCTRMQDLPIEHTAKLTGEQATTIRDYCLNDLGNTEMLLDTLSPQLALRGTMSAQYKLDLRSKSDAQIAEAVIVSELQKRTGVRPTRPDVTPGSVYFYHVPEYIRYNNPALQEMVSNLRRAAFVVGLDGYVRLPDEIEGLVLSVGNCEYRMGIGGLHSCEVSTTHLGSESVVILDRDVVSYYPSIVLNLRLFPNHLGESFLDVYRDLVNRRIAAKNAGDKVTSEALKITINSTFGKLGSKWSPLYSPDLMIQVTLTGQLALLMLIDRIESRNISVVSANTDGIVVKCLREREAELTEVISSWERDTCFATEESRYKALYSRDVNNYIAVKEDGGVKTKGTFSKSGLKKNPEFAICTEAVIAHLVEGTPVEQTIRECPDVRRFVTVRNVTGGAVKSGQPLGKVIRWYYSTRMKGIIQRADNGNKVPKSEGAMPLMQLAGELPSDIDYDKYIGMANEMLASFTNQ